jgi:hypothetical protein
MPRWTKLKKKLLKDFEEDEFSERQNKSNETVLVKEITKIITKRNKPIDTSKLVN